MDADTQAPDMVAGGAAGGMLSASGDEGAPEASSSPSSSSPSAGNPPPSAPDVSSLPASGDRKAPAGPAALPPVQKPGIFDTILNVLGGGNKQVSIDPASGRRVVTEGPPDRKRAIAHIFAGALEGMFAGLQNSQGPGGALKALGAGGQAGVNLGNQENQDQEQRAQQQFQRQQQMSKDTQEQQLKQAQTFETNQRAILTGRQSWNLGEAAKDKNIANNQPVLDAAHADETAGGGQIVKRSGIPYSQLMDEHSADGARHGTSNVYLIDGKRPILDPKTGEPKKDEFGDEQTEYTFSELDPHAQVKVPASMLDDAVEHGYNVPGYTPHTSVQTELQMPVHAAANLAHYMSGISNFSELTDKINSTLGLKGGAALDPTGIAKSMPQLGNALYTVSQHWDGKPSTLVASLDKMQAGGDPAAAAAARTLTTAIGGDRLDEFAEKLSNDKEAAKEAAKEGAKEPFEEAKENRVAARQDARDDARAHKNDDQLVIAGEPGQQQTQVMRKGELPQGWVQYPLKDPQALAGTVARFNDVQTKVNDLADFVQKGGMAHIQPGLVGDAIAEINKDVKIGAFGAELPTARFNALLDQENYKAMNQASRDFVRAYGFAREALTQLPAIQTFGKSNRINDTQLKASLALLPDHRMAGNTQAAMDQMQALQNVLDPLRKSIPQGLPGATMLPSFLERGQQQQQSAPAGAGQQAQPDPFAAFGGKLRPAKGTASQ